VRITASPLTFMILPISLGDKTRSVDSVYHRHGDPQAARSDPHRNAARGNDYEDIAKVMEDWIVGKRPAPVDPADLPKENAPNSTK